MASPLFQRGKRAPYVKVYTLGILSAALGSQAVHLIYRPNMQVPVESFITDPEVLQAYKDDLSNKKQEIEQILSKNKGKKEST